MGLEQAVREQWADEAIARCVVAALKEAQPERKDWEDLGDQEVQAWLYAASRLFRFQVNALASVLGSPGVDPGFAKSVGESVEEDGPLIEAVAAAGDPALWDSLSPSFSGDRLREARDVSRAQARELLRAACRGGI